jgi:hypothetical protein
MKKRHNFDPNSLDEEGGDTEFAKEEHLVGELQLLPL